jgi:hypothetical protein
MLEGLEVHPDRMRAKLEAGGGVLMAEALSMALARQLGKDQAHRIVQAVALRVASDGTDLRRAALEGAQVRAVLTPVKSTPRWTRRTILAGPASLSTAPCGHSRPSSRPTAPSCRPVEEYESDAAT